MYGIPAPLAPVTKKFTHPKLAPQAHFRPPVTSPWPPPRLATGPRSGVRHGLD